MLKEYELKEITGGGWSAALFAAAIRGINTVADLARSLGTAIRRIQTGNLC